MFKETIAQWCFNFITLLNIYIAIVILSYFLCDYFFNPYYSITFIRFLLFASVTFVLKQYFLPIYREVLNHWNTYILMLIGLFINLANCFIASDIERMLTILMWPLFLLILLEVLIYISVFYSMNVIIRESLLQEENLRMQNNQELLRLSSSSMAQRIQLMEDTELKNRLDAHDRRHFNRMILELLEQDKVYEASTFLRKQLEYVPLKNIHYCDNIAINAVTTYYATLAKSEGITSNINLDIPKELTIDSLELAMSISNLLENAIHGCRDMLNTRKKYINFTCHNVGRLIIEISNPCSSNVTLDEYGFPFTHEEVHGIGTKSVQSFAAKYNAELLYFIEDNIFKVQLIV